MFTKCDFFSSIFYRTECLLNLKEKNDVTYGYPYISHVLIFSLFSKMIFLLQCAPEYMHENLRENRIKNREISSLTNVFVNFSETSVWNIFCHGKSSISDVSQLSPAISSSSLPAPPDRCKNVPRVELLYFFC